MSDPVRAGHARPGPGSPGAKVGVLPLVKVSGAPVIDGYCLRVTKVLVRALGQTGLRACVETEVPPSCRFDVHLPEIGRRLGASALLMGDVREIPGHVCLRLQLTRASDGRCVWTCERSFRRLAARGALEDVAAEIAGEIKEATLRWTARSASGA